MHSHSAQPHNAHLCPFDFRLSAGNPQEQANQVEHENSGTTSQSRRARKHQRAKLARRVNASVQPPTPPEAHEGLSTAILDLPDCLLAEIFNKVN